MSLIKGIHHVALECRDFNEYNKAKEFYIDTLGLMAYREWSTGVMLDTGCGIVEILMNGEDSHIDGVIRHIAFATDDPDACILAVRNEGYDVFVEPSDVTIKCEPPMPLRIAFCKGPLGEILEFFCCK